MEKHTYFDIVKTDSELINRLEDIIHIPSSYDGYPLLKKKGWNILYIEPKDFHQKIDDEIKLFFKGFIDKKIYLIDLPLSQIMDRSEIELFQVQTYKDFLNLWSHYTDSRFLNGKYTENSNFQGLLRSFFIASNLGIFDDNLDWVFYNDVDYFLSAILYSDNIKHRVEEIFKDYAGKIPVDEIRKDISNFATKKW